MIPLEQRQQLTDNLTRRLDPPALMLAIAITLSVLAPATAKAEQVTLEEVAVIGRKPADMSGAALHGFTSYVTHPVAAAPPVNLADLLNSQPGVAFNGQGGLFQTVSIRGMARQRIGTFFLDLPVTTERRAGTALSFIDPVLVETLELQRGPVTTAYGAGNVAGLLRVVPRRYENRALLGYGGSGDEDLQLIQLASRNAFAGLSRRSASEARTTEGEPLNTGFTQFNFLAGGRIDTGDAEYELDLLLTRGEDIGKSNNLYPDRRITEYPFDQHVIVHLQRRQGEFNHTTLYAHHQELRTDVLRINERLNRVDNTSLDFGARTAFAASVGAASLNWGGEYNGRRRVRADETERDFATGTSTRQELLDGEQDDLALFLDLQRNLAGVDFSAGARAGRLWQEAGGWNARQETLYSGFLGVHWPVAQDLALSAEMSSGRRPAGLSERFFSGTTGRGVALGNPDLSSETVYSLDLGLQQRLGNIRWRAHVFMMELDDFIERLPVSDELTTYRNVDGGQIRGVEALLQWELSPQVQIELGGSVQEGERGNTQLQDVPADEIYATLAYQGEQWRGRLSWGHRFAKKDVALQEQPVGTANRLSGSLTWLPDPAWEVTLWGSNLLDDAYLLSTDEQATLAEERSLGIRLQYRWRT